jgi:hypothetical protein
MTPAAATDPAEARKRRKEIIQSQRSEGEAATSSNDNVDDAALTGHEDKPAVAEKKPPKKRKVDDQEIKEDSDDDDDDDDKKKTQIRYDPDVPMSKEQLAAWRREARRVRNRESAAASRQRIRNRINELEDEVGEWKTRYSQAMERLQSLNQTESASKN